MEALLLLFWRFFWRQRVTRQIFGQSTLVEGNLLRIVGALTFWNQVLFVFFVIAKSWRALKVTMNFDSIDCFLFLLFFLLEFNFFPGLLSFLVALSLFSFWKCTIFFHICFEWILFFSIAAESWGSLSLRFVDSVWREIWNRFHGSWRISVESDGSFYGASNVGP